MIVEASGRMCGCGRQGCLEAYASSSAIMSMVREGLSSGVDTLMKHHPPNLVITPAEVYLEYAQKGDALAIDILTKAGLYLGIGIANIINIFSPDAVILTGGLIEAKTYYLQTAMQTAYTTAIKELFEQTTIITTHLSDDIGLIGSAHVAFQAAEGLLNYGK
ncbi:MAG: ROK family protein, partial [Candidatus Magnetoovum sp. WYHC-5]|nr:ROK family protein [Candidatus Magnetoovum sp. WYHC-5]